MRISRSALYALGVAVAVTGIVGCSGGGPQSGFAPATQQSSATHRVANKASLTSGWKFTDARTILAYRAGKVTQSFIKPAAKNGALAYVTDPFAGVVYIYAWYLKSPPFNRGTWMGTIGGPLTEPLGVCSDKKGNVYITNYNFTTENGEIWEYPHGNVVPVYNPPLLDAGNVPFGCAVDPKTGHLAVANIETSIGGSGSVYIYPKTTPGTVPDEFFNIPTYTPPLFTPTNAEYYVGFDNKSHLFATGSLGFCNSLTCGVPFDAYVAEQVKCCPGNPMQPVKLVGPPLATIQYPGAVVWDGNGNLDIGDREAIPTTCAVAPVGCAAMYGTIEQPGPPSSPTQLKQNTLTTFNFTFSATGVNNGDVAWGVTTQSNRNIVPNTTGGGCSSSIPPSVVCTQVYAYKIGLNPVGMEWDAPGTTMLDPLSAAVSQ